MYSYHACKWNICYLDISCVLIVLKIIFFRHLFQEYTVPSVSNSLDQDQARHSNEPDLGPIPLQRLSADDTS